MKKNKTDSKNHSPRSAGAKVRFNPFNWIRTYFKRKSNRILD